jgi:hypothetical protein
MDMEAAALVAVLASLVLVGGSICGIAAVVRLAALQRALSALRHEVDFLRQRVVEIAGALKRLGGEERPEEKAAARLPSTRSGPECIEGRSPKSAAGEEKGEEKRGREDELAARPPVSPAPVPGKARGLRERGRSRAAEPAQEWWKHFEEKVGKQWIAWAGAVSCRRGRASP